jgi:putative DNA primase/helicase
VALTLGAYAAAKRLDVDFLTRICGLYECTRRFAGIDEPQVAMPYLDPERRLIAMQFRRKLTDAEDEGPRFLWLPRTVEDGREIKGPQPYGLWLLPQMRERGDRLIFVEGPSDAQTLWFHDEPAIGVPAATQWTPAWAALVAGFTHYYAVQEPGGSGVQFIAALVESFPDLRIITIPETWDDEDSA